MVKNEQKPKVKLDVKKRPRRAPRPWTSEEEAVLLACALRVAKENVPSLAKEGLRHRAPVAIHGKLTNMLRACAKGLPHTERAKNPPPTGAKKEEEEEVYELDDDE